MNYFLCDFNYQINENILYLKCKCYKVVNDSKEFYGFIEANKAFDISKDISEIEIEYKKSDMILKEDFIFEKYNDYIIVPIPDDKHLILIHISNIKTIFNDDVIDYVYNNVGQCIDKIDEHMYNENSKVFQADLDYLKSYLGQIQTIVLTKFKKRS